MGKFRRFILNLQFIFKPHYWIMTQPYSRKWDYIFNSMLDEYKFETSRDGGYTAKLGDKLIWVSNYPYDTFTPYNRGINGEKVEFRASRLTILKARKKYKKETDPYDPYDQYE